MSDPRMPTPVTFENTLRTDLMEHLTTSPSLTEFLTARLTDDIALARQVQAQAVSDGLDPDDLSLPALALAARVLREVEAKRAIVAEHSLIVLDDVESCECCSCWTVEDSYPQPMPCPTLRHLAAVYADDPDYREEWRA